MTGHGLRCSTIPIANSLLARTVSGLASLIRSRLAMWLTTVGLACSAHSKTRPLMIIITRCRSPSKPRSIARQPTIRSLCRLTLLVVVALIAKRNEDTQEAGRL